MESIVQDIQLAFRYSVHFTEDVFGPKNVLLARTVASGGSAARVLFVVDESVCRSFPVLLDAIEAYCQANRASLSLVCPPLTVPGGEQAKNDPRHVAAVHEAIHRHALCRHSYVIAVGGGALLDMAGYAAATAHRGLRLIRIPTTVLAQNDSGVGVKNGVNAYGRKNFLGTFTPPYAVINDSRFLATLLDRDWRAGAVEAVKVALIKDAAFFAWLAQHADRLVRRDMESMRQLIHRCAHLHLEHIATSGDPFETGSSRPLDFGHWAAHKLEQVTGYRLRHGEAVAIGIAIDATYSHLAGLLSEADHRRALDLLRRLGFALRVPEMARHLDEPTHPGSLLAGLSEFREHLGGELTIMLLRSIGQGVEVHDIDPALMAQAIEMVSSDEAGRGRQ